MTDFLNLLFILNDMKIVPVLFFISFFVIKGYSQFNIQEFNYINEVNYLRSNPKKYAAFVRESIGYSVTDSFTRAVALTEVIPLLETMQPLDTLIPSAEIRNWANQFSGYDTIKRTIRHDMQYLHNSKLKNYAQCIDFGTTNNPRGGIIEMLIDVCYENRGHRVILLSNAYSHISVRKIKVWGNEKNPFDCGLLWVSDFGNYEEFKQSPMQLEKKKYPKHPLCVKDE